MDPLSVAASIAGLVSIADVVFRRTYKYIKAVKDAQKEISALSNEISALFGILRRLELLACQVDEDVFDSTLRLEHIFECQQTLEKVNSILEKDDTSSLDDRLLESTRRRLRWPLSKSRTEKLIEEIERHKSTLTLALTADSMTGLLQALSAQSAIRKDIWSIKKELEQAREAKTRIFLDKERRQILNAFGSTNPNNVHQTSLRLRHPGTGIWLLEHDSFKHWCDTVNANLWLHGIPGAGKTVLASLVVEDFILKSDSNNAVAFFYCDYRDKAAQTPVNILGSLAKQIARQDEQSYEALQAFYHAHNPEGKMSLSYVAEDVRILLQEMVTYFDNVTIIVDALDECGEEAPSLIEQLTLLNDESNNVKILYLSRDEQDIRDRLGEYSQISVAANSSDLRLYVAAEIELRIRSKRLRIKENTLKELIMKRLVEGAEEMFRWVVCQIDYLCELPNDAARRKALYSLPPNLNATYDRILEDVNKSNEEVRTLVQKALRWISNAIEPLSSAALCEVVSVKPNDTKLDREALNAEDEVLRWCSSLVRKSADSKSIELAHFTVKEYLQSIDPVEGKFAAYGIRQETADCEMAKECLRYLLLEDFGQSFDASIEAFLQRNLDYPFRRYAAKFWAAHAQMHWGDPTIMELAKTLFNPSMTNPFVLWTQSFLLDGAHEEDLAQERGSSRLFRDAKRWGRIRDSFADYTARMTVASPLHYAAGLLLPDLCTWLLEEGCDVNSHGSHGRPMNWAINAKRLQSLASGDIIGRDQSKETRVNLFCQLMQLLLDNGADVTELSTPKGAHMFDVSPLKTVSEDYDGDLEPAKMLLRAGASCDREGIEYILEQYQDHDSLQTFIEAIDLSALTQDVHGHLMKCLAPKEGAQVDHAFQKAVQFAKQNPQGQDSLRAILFSVVRFRQTTRLKALLTDLNPDLDVQDSSYGSSPLHIAADRGFADIMEVLLDHGASINVTDEMDETPVHKAATAMGGRDTECLQLLIRRDADLHRISDDGMTIWHFAALAGNCSALKILKELPSERLPSPTAVTTQGRSALFCAAEAGSKEALDLLWAQSDGPSTRDINGDTLLHCAVATRSSAVIQYLLDKKEDAQAVSHDGSTLLHFAITSYPRNSFCKVQRSSEVEVIKILLAAGVNPDVARKNGITPLHMLIWFNKDSSEPWTASCAALLEKMSLINQTDSDGDTPFHLICMPNRLDELYGVERLPVEDAQGQDFLEGSDDGEDKTYLEILSRSVSAFRLLVQKKPDALKENKLGFSPLQFILDCFERNTKLAIPENSRQRWQPKILLDMLFLLLDSIPVALPLPNTTHGVSALNVAIRTGFPEFIERMLIRSPDVDVKDQSSPSHFSAIETACLWGCDLKTFKTLLQSSKHLHELTSKGAGLIHLACEKDSGASIDIISTLIDAGIDVNMRNKIQETPLILAADAARIDKLELLLARGADPSASDDYGYDAVTTAAQVGEIGILYSLRSYQARWDGRVSISLVEASVNRVTALHLAAWKGHSQIVEYLLEEKLSAEVDCFSEFDFTPLHLACLEGNTRTVSLLLLKGADVSRKDQLSGSLPLHLAAKSGNKSTVELLLENGSDVLETDASGLTAELIARAFEYVDLADFLHFNAQEKGNVSFQILFNEII